MSTRGPQPEKLHCSVAQVRADGLQRHKRAGVERGGKAPFSGNKSYKPNLRGTEVARGLVATQGADTEQGRRSARWGGGGRRAGPPGRLTRVRTA